MGQIADRLKRQRSGQVATGRRDDKGFRERLEAATEAKKALLEKFRAQAASEEAEHARSTATQAAQTTDAKTAVRKKKQ